MSENLQAELAAAEDEITRWRQTVDNIVGAKAAAQVVVDASESRRAECALGAATGDAGAVSAMKKIHSEDQTARRQLEDLNLALAPAQRHLVNAEQAAVAIQREINQVAREKLSRKRISNASLIDKKFVELVALVIERDQLGAELQGYHLEMLASRGYSHSTSFSQSDALTGQGRLMAALPPEIFGRLFPTVPRGEFCKLETSEAAFFGLQPEKEDEGKAA